jgi:hypothetical protein
VNSTEFDLLLRLECHLRQLYQRLGSDYAALELIHATSEGSHVATENIPPVGQDSALLNGASGRLLFQCAAQRSRIAVAAASSLCRALPGLCLETSRAEAPHEQQIHAQASTWYKLAEFRAPAGAIVLYASCPTLVHQLAALPSVSQSVNESVNEHLRVEPAEAYTITCTLALALNDHTAAHSYEQSLREQGISIGSGWRWRLSWSCGHLNCIFNAGRHNFILEIAMESSSDLTKDQLNLGLELRLGTIELPLSELVRLREGCPLQVGAQWPIAGLLLLEGRPWRHCQLQNEGQGVSLLLGKKVQAGGVSDLRKNAPAT